MRAQRIRLMFVVCSFSFYTQCYNWANEKPRGDTYEDARPREKHFLMSDNPLNSTRSTMRNEYITGEESAKAIYYATAYLYDDWESSAALYYAISDIIMTNWWRINMWRQSPESSFHDTYLWTTAKEGHFSKSIYIHNPPSVFTRTWGMVSCKLTDDSYQSP